MTTDTALNQQNKRLAWQYWQELEGAEAGVAADVIRRYLHPDSQWWGPDPISSLRGPDAVAAQFWQPLSQSFAGLSRQNHIFFGGRSSGRRDGLGDGHMWVCGTGYFHGRFVEDYLSIPATDADVRIRWGEFLKIQQNQVVETFILLDLVDLMQQAGYQVLPPSRGIDGLYPPPAAGDGITMEARNEKVSAHTLDHIRRFIFDGLNSYDQSDLKSMGMADFFSPNVKWYGPGGIGACLSFDEFERHHQGAWLHAFPDRQVQDLDALIAEGPYSGGPGWAGVLATHTGQYLDCPATGNPIAFNGLDIWKLENDRYVENWVFVDMIHLFRQFGVDLFARLARP